MPFPPAAFSVALHRNTSKKMNNKNIADISERVLYSINILYFFIAHIVV